MSDSLECQITSQKPNLALFFVKLIFEYVRSMMFKFPRNNIFGEHVH